MITVPELRTISYFLPLAGPLAWFVHFAVMYGTQALICRTFSDADRFQMIVATIISTSAALGFIALVAVLPWRRRFAGSQNDASCFCRALSITLAALSALAILWVASPTLILPACTIPR